MKKFPHSVKSFLLCVLTCDDAVKNFDSVLVPDPLNVVFCILWESQGFFKNQCFEMSSFYALGLSSEHIVVSFHLETCPSDFGHFLTFSDKFLPFICCFLSLESLLVECWLFWTISLILLLFSPIFHLFEFCPTFGEISLTLFSKYSVEFFISNSASPFPFGMFLFQRC